MLKEYNIKALKSDIVKKFGSVSAFARAIGRGEIDTSKMIYMIDYRLNKSVLGSKKIEARNDFDELRKLCDDVETDKTDKITAERREALRAAINLNCANVEVCAERYGFSKSLIYAILNTSQKTLTKSVIDIFEKFNV